MSEQLTLKAFFRRYFLAFLGGIFAAYFSLAFAVALSFVTYFQNAPLADSGLYIFLAGAALTLLVVHSNFMIVRGRPWWVWVVAGVLVACLLFVLPMIHYAPPRAIYVLALLSPLLGLLFLNSNGQREMRSKLVDIRHERERMKQSLKASRRR
ncbi:hypothetical protein PMI30_02934 [Pseudomonas sp. GM50]|uniref:hypothetical protein n=1 Tax=Pseudomonas sp. GM50 TaxID=1144332 RepID=UPI000270A853|nr:hypothetical protein [Pseudomonas sp. GM50]EJM66048.1 hypothetical protein PMI30_02934 [Pseudomonas sp. GM50]